MKCKDCDYKMKGFFACEPDKYACIGVKEPFIIGDLDVECTEYPEKRDVSTVGSVISVGVIEEPEPVQAYVGDDGIYVPSEYDIRYHRMLISKELFVEAYNKWIKNDTSKHSHLFHGQDDADCRCE